MAVAMFIHSTRGIKLSVDLILSFPMFYRNLLCRSICRDLHPLLRKRTWVLHTIPINYTAVNRPRILNLLSSLDQILTHQALVLARLVTITKVTIPFILLRHRPTNWRRKKKQTSREMLRSTSTILYLPRVVLPDRFILFRRYLLLRDLSSLRIRGKLLRSRAQEAAGRTRWIGLPPYLIRLYRLYPLVPVRSNTATTHLHSTPAPIISRSSSSSTFSLLRRTIPIKLILLLHLVLSTSKSTMNLWESRRQRC